MKDCLLLSGGLILLSGCFPTVSLHDLHPDWPDEVNVLVAKSEFRKGMTQDQVECSLGIGVWNRHIHKFPDSSHVGQGRVTACYWLDKDKFGLPRHTFVANYVDGRLAGWDDYYRD